MNTKKLRQKILDLAIHGKLVSQDPADEPASALLQRIRVEKERLIKEGKIKRSRKSTKTSDTPHYEQIPFDVPQGWVWCRLDDLAFYKKGPFGSGLTKSMFVPKSDDAYKVYEQKNVIQKNASLGSYYISKDKYKELCGFAVQSSDILVSCAGTIGETYVLPEDSEEGIINQALMLIRLHIRDITDFYLVYFDYILKEKVNKESKGTAIKNIPPLDVLKPLLFPLPPLAEQTRIVAEIERWFALIDTIEQGKANLQTAIKQAKNKILELAISGKLVPQAPTDEPAPELLKRINPKAHITCDNEHNGKLPQGWGKIMIGEVCENINGLWRGKKGPLINVGVIRNANFTKGFKLDYSKIKHIDVEERAFEKRHLLDGDLIVEKSGGSDAYPVGRAVIYEGKSSLYSFSNFTMILRPKDKKQILSKYLFITY